MNTIIIVLYFPNWNHIFCSIKNLHGCDIILIDNTPHATVPIALEKIIKDSSSSIVYVSLGGNYGIATAQNIGVRIAASIGKSKNLIFFDQDSKIEEDYVQKIVKEFFLLHKEIPKLATLGPSVYEAKSGKRYKTKGQYSNNGIILVDNIISSGSIVPLELFDKDKIGCYKDELFIDLVDSEWCWRANSKGYKCAITSNVILSHQVGNGYIKLPGISFIISNPIRNYYQIRNSIIICKLDYVKIGQKVNLLLHQILYFLIVPFLRIKGKKNILKNMAMGVKDAFFGRTSLYTADNIKPIIYISGNNVNYSLLESKYGNQWVIRALAKD